MSETPHLLPCPWCGGKAIRCENHTGYQMFWVLCDACHASPGDRPTPVEAITAWNRRADLSGSEGEGVLASRDLSHTHNAAMRASPCTDQDGEG